MMTELRKVLKEPRYIKFYWEGVRYGVVIGCLITILAFLIAFA
nr:MAG TPA: hypothetical protein [Caudoviricetes sp.]